jgi:hypothetical protein
VTEPTNIPQSVPEKKETTEKYEKRIAKMSNRQLVSEIRKQKKTLTERHIQFKLLSVLEVLMQSHKRGINPYLRG